MPRPGKNTIFYSGLLAGHAKDRADIVPGEGDTTRVHDSSWADGMQQGFGYTLPTPIARTCGDDLDRYGGRYARDRVGPARALTSTGT